MNKKFRDKHKKVMGYKQGKELRQNNIQGTVKNQYSEMECGADSPWHTPSMRMQWRSPQEGPAKYYLVHVTTVLLAAPQLAGAYCPPLCAGFQQIHMLSRLNPYLLPSRRTEKQSVLY